MKLNAFKFQLKNFAFALLLLLGAGGAYQLVGLNPVQWDMTQNTINSLEPSSVEVLRQMQGVVNITVYATGQDAQLGDVRRLVREFVALYQVHKPDIVLNFVDPVKQPELVRKEQIQANGEMVVEFAGRNEHLVVLNEQALSGALLRLAHSKDQLVMYLDGHGERKLDGIANFDLGDFGGKLKKNGFHIASLNLAVAQDVPHNASMLVITQPQVELLPGEVDKLLRYVDAGGNLLWLLDAEPLRGLQPLADKLGVQLTEGRVIDPAAAQMNAPADWTLGASYPPHAITRSFNLVTAFPYSRALKAAANGDWKASTLVEGAAHGWVSNNPAGGTLSFDKEHDQAGPVPIAIALQRRIQQRDQRVVVVGSGSFLANAYSGNGGNLDLGISMVNWLGQQDNLITIQPRAAKDNAITLSKNQLIALSGGWLVGLPLLCVLLGGMLWWRRKA
jgi:ABC-type uncharacterized transport system